MTRLALLTVLLMLGCGSGGESGVSCQMNLECNAGLTCTGLPSFASDGGACVETTRSCALPCTTSPECNSSGSSRTFSCVGDCTGQKFCVPIF